MNGCAQICSSLVLILISCDIIQGFLASVFFTQTSYYIVRLFVLLVKFLSFRSWSCIMVLDLLIFITFCVSRRRRKMYCGHVRLCVCLSAAVCPHYCTDPDVTWGHGRGCPLVVHYWADLQLGHGLRCYGKITRTLVTSLRPSRDMTT